MAQKLTAITLDKKHAQGYGGEILINPDHVIALQPFGEDQTKIFISNRDNLVVNEKLESVVKKLGFGVAGKGIFS